MSASLKAAYGISAPIKPCGRLHWEEDRITDLVMVNSSNRA